jgi:hypothetical protein
MRMDNASRQIKKRAGWPALAVAAALIGGY